MYKRANRLGGPVGFVDLAHASVMVADVGNPRQFLVVTGSRMFRIRALSKNSRLAWTRCLKGSAEAYSAAVAARACGYAIAAARSIFRPCQQRREG